ncbi:hypothetical protein ACFV0O_03385 [Kitasatospora sp. NPDC059577]
MTPAATRAPPVRRYAQPVQAIAARRGSSGVTVLRTGEAAGRTAR